MSLKESFDGKKVLVTGAGRGFGRLIVKRLHSYNAKVYALSRTLETLKTLEEECPGVETICVDLSNWEATREALSKLDAFDCLINNAAFIVVKTVMQTSQKEFDEIFNINVKSIMNTCQIIAEKMIQASKKGSIVNVSSVAAGRPSPHTAPYGMSKAALEYMSKCLAVELAPKGIRVNIFQPAGMDTEMLKELGSGLDDVLQKEDVFKNVMISRTPTRCILMPLDECVNAILFLLSDLVTQVVGQTITIDGGYLCT